jgi:predicted ATP-grasp superfamily ATP-dependent carboligase
MNEEKETDWTEVMLYLREQVNARRIEIPNDKQLIDSLEAVKERIDGTVNESTMDGRVRSLALAIWAGRKK